MGYKTLYRRWRPKVFEDIIGQDQIVTILKNQIKYLNIAHAYLFTGMRGTGKTSTARIFARAVNCMSPEDSSPCNVCEICEGILRENIMDVIEIDAASNRGIDNIRELREHTKYNPSLGRYKIYIIDEVHMLTSEAFNALLKTLEEPPAHVIFILATTEPNRLPATILSRCQRLDFKPVKIKDIMEHLSLVCKDLSIAYEEEALRLIALNSEGSVRDALSILDRSISFNNEILKYNDVVDILGAVNYEFIFNLAENIAKQNTSNVLTLINQIFMEGKDVENLIKDLIFHFRSLLFVKMDVEIDEILVLPEEKLKQLKEQGNLFNINQISYCIHTLSDLVTKLKYSSQSRVLMEITVASLCNKELVDSLEGIIERVKQLEKAITSGQINIMGNGEKTINYKVNKVDSLVFDSISSKQGLIKKCGAKKLTGTEDTKIVNKQKEESAYTEHTKEGTNHGKKLENNKKPKDDQAALISIKNVWGQISNQMIKDKKAPIEALLKEGTIEKLDGGILTISLKKEFEFHRDKLDKEEVKNYISEVIARFTNQNIKLSFVMEGETSLFNEDNKQGDPIQKLKEILPGEIFDMVEIIDE